MSRPRGASSPRTFRGPRRICNRDAEHVRGAPELVVEIGSPAARQRDETIELRLSERAGVTEYWVIDPEVDVVRVYRRSEALFDRPLGLSLEKGDVVAASTGITAVTDLRRIAASRLRTAGIVRVRPLTFDL